MIFGSSMNESSVERLNGTISNIDTICSFEATCTKDGLLRVNMPLSQRLWAPGYLLPFPAWTVFFFPGQTSHAYDYNYFFNNVRENAAIRVKAWQKKDKNLIVDVPDRNV